MNITYFGFNEGLIIHDGKNHSIKKPKTENYELRKIFDIHKQDDGSLILATSKGIGVYENGEIKPFKSSQNIEDYVLDINESPDGNLYFGSDEGLLQLTPQNELIHFSKEYNFNVGRIRQTTNDSQGNLCIASDEGLYKKVGNQVEKINSIKTNEVIQSIVFDNKNRLWAGLRTGFLQT